MDMLSQMVGTGDYYDILLLGRTGMGKSTFGNKLLGINPRTKMPYKDGVIIKMWGVNDNDRELFFESGGGMHSVHHKCKILSNGSVRVMDTIGFCHDGLTRKYGVAPAFRVTMQHVLEAQKTSNLQFSRIVYFLPKRGVPERRDGTLTEEIKYIYDCFGQQIFDNMIIAITNSKRIFFQNCPLDEEDAAETRKNFSLSYKEAVSGKEDVTCPSVCKCPPVVYLPYSMDPEQVLELIINTKVISAIPENMVLRNPKFQLSFQYHKKMCSKCGIKFTCRWSESGEEHVIGVVEGSAGWHDPVRERYDPSHTYCHPMFVPKYKGLKGFVLQAMRSFESSDEVCINCNSPPGWPGCHPVNQNFEISGREMETKTIVTRHVWQQS